METLNQLEDTPQPTPLATIGETGLDPHTSLLTFLETAGVEGLDDNGRLDLLERASMANFIAAVAVIHQKLTPEGDPNPMPRPMGVTDNKVKTVFTAEPENRYGILEHAFNKSKELISKYRAEGGSLRNVLERCGNLAAFSIVLAHSFRDGNGRTARTMGELIKFGYQKSDPDSIRYLNFISKGRPKQGFRVSSYVPKIDDADKNPLGFLDFVAATNLPFEDSLYLDKVHRGNFTTPRTVN